MGIIEFGQPGRSVAAAAWGGRSSARRGAYFERVTANALRNWLSRRGDVNHLFHDVANLENVKCPGMRPLDLGASNIDHVVLSGNGWLLVDAKGCAAGQLRVVDGHGVLIGNDGAAHPQPWMDDAKAYARAGVLYRLTDKKPGVMVWVVPDHTDHSHSSS